MKRLNGKKKAGCMNSLNAASLDLEGKNDEKIEWKEESRVYACVRGRGWGS